MFKLATQDLKGVDPGSLVMFKNDGETRLAFRSDQVSSEQADSVMMAVLDTRQADDKTPIGRWMPAPLTEQVVNLSHNFIIEPDLRSVLPEKAVLEIRDAGLLLTVEEDGYGLPLVMQDSQDRVILDLSSGLTRRFDVNHVAAIGRWRLGVATAPEHVQWLFDSESGYLSGASW